MKLVKPILEGIKLAALVGAVALVVWSMPEYERHDVHQAVEAGQSVSR